IPEAEVNVVERCSGHGGSWGVMKGNFDTALKIGRPAARRALESVPKYVVSECPLAGLHILQGMERLAEKEDPKPAVPVHAPHPVQLLARAYGDNGK
ncbi:unnamed protein product, partial [Discosporangium mesarthrocarpum]